MILITAATRWEARPLAQAWDLRSERGSITSYRGSVSSRPVLVLETGMGPERTRQALDALPARGPELVISSGFAGALQPGMRSGDLVADPHGAPLELLAAARAAAQSAPLHLGRIVSVSSPLCEPADKRATGGRLRAAAVDMESATVRQWAMNEGSDFIALRVLLDTLDERLPRAMPNGQDAASLARYALRNWGDIPLMLRLAVQQRRGMRRLTAFLSHFLRDTLRGYKWMEGAVLDEKNA